MENNEIDYKQQLIKLSNQVSSVSSTVSSGSHQISSSIKGLEASLNFTNFLLLALIIAVLFNTFVKWKKDKKN